VSGTALSATDLITGTGAGTAAVDASASPSQSSMPALGTAPTSEAGSRSTPAEDLHALITGGGARVGIAGGMDGLHFGSQLGTAHQDPTLLGLAAPTHHAAIV
jgi:hypothetical protein